MTIYIYQFNSTLLGFINIKFQMITIIHIMGQLKLHIVYNANESRNSFYIGLIPSHSFRSSQV